MATTTAPQLLYMLDEDLYRLGNSTEPKLAHVRLTDVITYERNRILRVRATGIGISLLNEARLEKLHPIGWLWKIPRQTPMPNGLAWNPDPDSTKEGHFFLCPDMTMDRYRALLSELALHCERIRKL